MRTPTIMLAHDHELCRESLRKILEPEFKVVASVTEGRSVVSQALKRKPDIILADINMPFLNGIEAAREIKKSNPEAKIIFLAMHWDPQYAAEALNAGASGYVVKRFSAREVLTAIRKVLGGSSYLSLLISSRVLALQRSLKHGKQKLHELTNRQREVLQLVAEGRSAKEIARVLNLSHRTIEFHKHRMMEALGLHTIAELTRFAIQQRVLAV